MIFLAADGHYDAASLMQMLSPSTGGVLNFIPGSSGLNDSRGNITLPDPGGSMLNTQGLWNIVHELGHGFADGLSEKMRRPFEDSFWPTKFSQNWSGNQEQGWTWTDVRGLNAASDYRPVTTYSQPDYLDPGEEYAETFAAVVVDYNNSQAGYAGLIGYPAGTRAVDSKRNGVILHYLQGGN